jgi:hypothetical protein
LPIHRNEHSKRPGFTDTFKGAAHSRAVMLGVLREALADADAMTLLGEFSSHRRAAVMQIVAQARQRGERIDKTAETLAVDQLFGCCGTDKSSGTPLSTSARPPCLPARRLCSFAPNAQEPYRNS